MTLAAISVYQPAAWCLATGRKRIENRRWKPPQGLVGKESAIAIHASKVYDTDFVDWAKNAVDGPAFAPPAVSSAELAFGAVIALGTLVDVVTTSPDPWFVGPYGLVIDDVVAIDPVPLPGRQKWWILDRTQEAAVRQRHLEAMEPCHLCQAPRGTKGIPFGAVCGQCGEGPRRDFAMQAAHPGQGNLFAPRRERR